MRLSCTGATVLVLFSLVSGAAAGGEKTPDSQGLTFFGWSDQHVQTDGNADHLLAAIDAMNGLPGLKYPARIGGVVQTPVFVFGCGDIAEWPTNAAKNRYAELIEDRLKYPAYDIAGNHDSGGKVPSETLHRWIIARHGGLSYSFDCQGVHFTAVFSEYDDSLNSPAQPVSQKALDFIRSDLAGLAGDVPVVVALHLCFDAITNRDELIDAFGETNVILVLGGHYHKSKVDRYRDIDFVQLPSPAPKSEREIMVVHVADARLTAIPYNYATGRWCEEPGKMLDVPIRPPQTK